MSTFTLPAAALLDAARAVAGGQQYPHGTLYIVATPIGNLGDFTLRAIHVLSLVDAVACEDTRVSGALLRHLGLDKPLLAVHEHNEQGASARVVARLQAGERVAYLSDAGTPAVSDPGAVLAAQVRAAGLPVVPLPGASAVVTALSACGDAGGGAAFRFAGFAPAKGRDRAQWLDQVVQASEAQVLFEAPHRIDDLLARLAESAPDRTLTICRELTKQFEQIATMPCGEGPAWLAADDNRKRGEFVLVLHAPAKVTPAEDDALPADVERQLGILLAALPVKQAAALVAEMSGLPRKRLYARALQLRSADPDDEDAGDSPDGSEA